MIALILLLFYVLAVSETVPLVQEVLVSPPPPVILFRPVSQGNTDSSLDSLNFQRRTLQARIVFLQNEICLGVKILACALLMVIL